MSRFDINFQRNRFEHLRYYAEKGIPAELSLIRIDEPLVNGQGVYNFNLKKENLSASESNLKRNDLFVCLGLGVFLTVKDSTKPGTEQLLTYALQENTSAGIVGFKTQDINALYNGFLHITTGTTVNFNALPCGLFERIPCYQPELVYDGSAGMIANGAKPAFDLNRDLQIMAEELVFAGTQDHKIQVSFPTFAAADYTSATSNCETYISFVALGYRVIGGTSETYKNDKTNPFASAI